MAGRRKLVQTQWLWGTIVQVGYGSEVAYVPYSVQGSGFLLTWRETKPKKKTGREKKKPTNNSFFTVSLQRNILRL